MEIIYKNGNLLDAQTTVIGHQVNCQGVMGSGVAKQIRDKWPLIFSNYQVKCQSPISPLGDVLIVKVSDNQYIANIFGQYNYGTNGERYTSYDALDIAFSRLKYTMVENNFKSLAIPYKIIVKSSKNTAQSIVLFSANIVFTIINSLIKSIEGGNAKIPSIETTHNQPVFLQLQL